MEHTTAATIAMLDDLLVEVADQLVGARTISTWSDGGTHFRSNSFLAYMGTAVPNRFMKNTSVSYGVVNHF